MLSHAVDIHNAERVQIKHRSGGTDLNQLFSCRGGGSGARDGWEGVAIVS